MQIRHREWDLGEPKLAPIVHQSRPIAKGEDGNSEQEGHLPHPSLGNAPRRPHRRPFARRQECSGLRRHRALVADGE